MIAVAEAMARTDPTAAFLYVGTREGPERALAEASGLPYARVAAGRLRRYPSWRNLVDPVLVVVGIAQALAIVRRFRPDVAFGAGGFATVPPLLAARLAGARIAIHQQDAVPGLANRILTRFASSITVAFEGSAGSFSRPASVVGNPVRAAVLRGDPALARARFGLNAEKPVVLVTGGGTGALALNHIVAAAAPGLAETCETIHLTGMGKTVPILSIAGYRQIEFLTTEMPHVLAAADVVITRAGMSSLAEVGALAKPAIIVPMPRSHQEANAEVFSKKGAAIVRREEDLTAEGLVGDVRGLLEDTARREALGQAAGRLLPPRAAEAVAEGLVNLAATASPG